MWPALPFAKEPGSWVMFLAAFLAGAVERGTVDGLTALIFVSLCLLLATKPAFALFLRRPERAGLASLLLWGGGGTAGLLYSSVKFPSLLVLYLPGAVLLSLYFVLAGKGSLVLQECCGMAVMGLVAALAASLGGDVSAHLYLWPMFFLFYLSSSFRVRLGITRYRIIAACYCGGIVLVSLALALSSGKMLFLSFLPLLEDLWASLRPRKERFKRIGIIESAKTVVFAVLLLALSG